MPLEVRDSSDGSIIHNSTYTAGDFEQTELTEASRTNVFAQGEMQMRQWIFDGIRMGYSDTKLEAPLTTQWNTDLDVVQLYFNLGGKTSFTEDNGHSFSFAQLEHNLWYRPDFHGNIEYAGSGNRSFIIQFTKSAFARVCGDTLHRDFSKTISNGSSVACSSQNAVIDMRMLAVINDVVHCKIESTARKLYLSAKCMELLALQAESFYHAQAPAYVYCKTEYDRERLIFARDYLLQRYDVPPTLAELARMAGINEFKLKNGFRELFGNSVFAYLNEYKMELARTGLLSGEKTASELAYDLGYASLQHFSTAFRKKFGYPPSALKK